MHHQLKKISLLLFIILLNTSCSKNSSQGNTSGASVKKNIEITSETSQQSDNQEDCDEKAKKTIEIKPETISLSGGEEGCSLEEADSHEIEFKNPSSEVLDK